MSSTVSLCLACAASLPPRKASSDIYYTSCCARPICPRCIAANPRLSRYNPCLRCLAGVKAVSTSSAELVFSRAHHDNAGVRMNIDGSVRDEDIFVVEDEDDMDEEVSDAGTPDSSPPRANDTVSQQNRSTPVGTSLTGTKEDISPTGQEGAKTEFTSGLPPKYFIRPDDTLLGISLKLGIDGRALCRLNNLPVSTLRTTPHLLHTRAFLILPPSVRAPPLSPSEQALDDDRRARLAVERAETHLQSMTKETDRDIAKAYVALAGMHRDMGEAGDMKEFAKEAKADNGLRKRRIRTVGQGESLGEGSLEGHATDQYYDDEEWEARERAEGRKVDIPPFPYFASPNASTSRVAEKLPVAVQEDQKPWWRWRA